MPRLSASLLLAAALASFPAVAGEWPQILGPHRNGAAVDERLAAAWPEGGPPVAWSYELGEGYAGPAVAGGRVFVFHRVGDRERAEALDADSGKQIWSQDFDATYRGGINPDVGPRCVPLVYGERVILFGAAGDLHCVTAKAGMPVWSRDTYGDFGGSEGFFGAGSTPIVVDGKVLANVGGRDGAGIVAFDLESGKTAWQATDEGAGYSSPTIAEIDGKQRVIFVTRLNMVAIDPADGGVTWRRPFGQRGPTVNAATPLVFGGRLFLSASYGIGAQMYELGADSPVWSSDDVMSSQYTTCVHREGFLYGVDGREDVGEASLRCIEAATGKVRWSQEGFGVAHVILSGDKLLILTIDGGLMLAEAQPAAYRELQRAEIFRGACRALPALSAGRLIARDSHEGGELKCVMVGESEK